MPEPTTMGDAQARICHRCHTPVRTGPFTDQDTNTVEVLTVEDVTLPGSQVPRTRVHQCSAGDDTAPPAAGASESAAACIHVLRDDVRLARRGSTLVNVALADLTVALAEVDRLRSEAAALRAAGDALADVGHRVAHSRRSADFGELLNAAFAWRSAAGSPTTGAHHEQRDPVEDTVVIMVDHTERRLPRVPGTGVELREMLGVPADWHLWWCRDTRDRRVQDWELAAQGIDITGADVFFFTAPGRINASAADPGDDEPRHEVEYPQVLIREVVDLRAGQANYQETVRKLRGENGTAWERVHELHGENFQLRSEAATLRDAAPTPALTTARARLLGAVDEILAQYPQGKPPSPPYVARLAAARADIRRELDAWQPAAGSPTAESPAECEAAAEVVAESASATGRASVDQLLTWLRRQAAEWRTGSTVLDRDRKIRASCADDLDWLVEQIVPKPANEPVRDNQEGGDRA